MSKLRVLGDGSSNGVNIERFSPGISGVRVELAIPVGDVVLGFVGRLTHDKGIPELLWAFDEVLKVEPDCWLLLVGWFDVSEDALDERWKRQIAVHPRIHHTGYVADTTGYYRAMDVLILPTHREGFPNVVLEAGACGVPVIVTESTGARDAVLAEVTGKLIPVGYPEAIVEALLQLIREPETRKRMGEAGRRWVVQRYSNERVLALTTEFYLELLAGKGVSAGLDQ